MIKLLIGPMGSGKSEELLRICKRYELAGKKVLYISSEKSGKKISSRNGISIDCISDLIDTNCDVIGIDEAQFFDEEIVTYVDEQANKGKIIIISALDADFKRKPFGHISSIIPLAEHMTKLNGICAICGEEGFFSKKLNLELDDISKEKYICTCRKHYFEN